MWEGNFGPKLTGGVVAEVAHFGVMSPATASIYNIRYMVYIAGLGPIDLAVSTKAGPYNSINNMYVPCKTTQQVI